LPVPVSLRKASRSRQTASTAGRGLPAPCVTCAWETSLRHWPWCTREDVHQGRALPEAGPIWGRMPGPEELVGVPWTKAARDRQTAAFIVRVSPPDRPLRCPG